MVELCERDLCTGCTACVNACPKQCISMEEAYDGFMYPRVYHEICTECGVCRRVCPVLSERERPSRFRPPRVYAAVSRDRIALVRSSSGGLFYELSREVLANHGVVFGAAYTDQMRVVHTAVYLLEDLRVLQGSKYVQSDLNNCYQSVEKLLNNRWIVFFSGTPCQIDGLYNYLGGDRDNLITCDLVCKGVLSPGLFTKYVSYLEEKYRVPVTSINFRSKQFGWGLTTEIAFGNGSNRIVGGIDDTFVRSLGLGYVRESCYHCKYTSLQRIADITLGDFWNIKGFGTRGIDPRLGVSLVLINSQKGNDLFTSTGSRIYVEERDIEDACKSQSSSFSDPIDRPESRSSLFHDARYMSYRELASLYLLERGLRGTLKRFVPQRISRYVSAMIRYLRNQFDGVESLHHS